MNGDLKLLVSKLATARNNPILILNLDEISPSSTMQLHERLLGKKFNELDVILQTPGGHIDSAFNIVKMLRSRASKINVIVPLFAKSAGTLVCLGADKILLTEISELGPLDTQIREFQDGDSHSYKSALNGFRALEQAQAHALEALDTAAKLLVRRTGLKMSEAIRLAIDFAGLTSQPLYSQLNPKIIGEYARALDVGKKYGELVLIRYMKWLPLNAIEAMNTLVYGYPSHEFVLDQEELARIGFPSEELPYDQSEIACKIRTLFLQHQGNIIDLIEMPKSEDVYVPRNNT